jgi:phosphopantothenoylcysteine decarboxylase/phosphopantothenate--cysteine ligase
VAKILITSGPTREYLDPVRFLSNGSSGKMGAAMAAAAIAAGHEVVVISGPVAIAYPSAARVVWVTTTEQMRDAAVEHFPQCQGAIAVAAPCDFRPVQIQAQKIRKSGSRFAIEFDETPDVIAELGRMKQPDQWTVAFALETEDPVSRAKAKMRAKRADLIVLNPPAAIDGDTCSVEIIGADQSITPAHGPKSLVAQAIFQRIETELLGPRARSSR